MKNKLFFLFLLFVIILTSGWGCKGVDNKALPYIKPITLNYWRVWDGPDDFSDIINSYQNRHPFVKINYRKLRYNEYEQELIEAFATDRGPDIFSIHNTWTKKYQSKGLISPMPSKITMAYPVVKGKIKKEVVYELHNSKIISDKNLKNDFIDTIYNDVTISSKNSKTNKTENKIYGLPLSVDTLVMYYNKDLFNNAGITAPPAFWNREFQQDVKKLTKQNNKGEIIQSGVALGGGKNIERSTDILSVLMMQNGTTMMEGDIVKFHQTPSTFKDKNYSPGLEALRFYTDFSNPAKEVYSWNNSLNNSLDLFIQGKLAMMFGYSYMLPEIKARSPKLNFEIAPLPQIEGNNQSANFANYWVEAVSKKILTNPDNLKKGKTYTNQKLNTAWDFVLYAAKEKNVQSYLNKTKKPTALRSLIDKQKKDSELSEFADQLLTAKSWYKGKDANVAEKIIKDMIDSAIKGKDSLEGIISLGAKKVQQTIN